MKKDETLPRLIGDRIRDHRKRHGFSLARLSEISGVSTPMISKIEKGQSLPPISTYANIARGLGISLSELVAEDISQQNLSIVKAGESEPVSNGIYDAYSLAKHFSGKKFAPFLMHFPAHKDYHKALTHSNVQEMLYILKGSIEFSYEGRKVILEKGDCVCFNGAVPHTSRTLGDEDVLILAVQISE